MKYYEGCQEEAREKTVAFREKQNMDFEFKKECVERLGKDFVMEPTEGSEKKGTCWSCGRKRRVRPYYAEGEVER